MNIIPEYVVCHHCGSEQLSIYAKCQSCGQTLAAEPQPNPVSDMDARLAEAQKMLNQYYEARVNVRVRQAHQVHKLLRGTPTEYADASKDLRQAKEEARNIAYQIIELMGVDLAETSREVEV